jgi:LemA protein
MDKARSNKYWFILALILVVLVSYTGFTYNNLVKSDEGVKKTWSDLQSAYQRRIDLVPSLVSVVKGSSGFEMKTLEDLMNARSKAQQIIISSNTADYQSYQHVETAQGEVAQSVNRVIAIAEKYPDLKSTKNYLYLQAQLEGTERRIKVSRNDFNSFVADYNKKVRQFPSSLVAGIFGFKLKEGFSSDMNAQNPPEVKF